GVRAVIGSPAPLGPSPTFVESDAGLHELVSLANGQQNGSILLHYALHGDSQTILEANKDNCDPMAGETAGCGYYPGGGMDIELKADYSDHTSLLYGLSYGAFSNQSSFIYVHGHDDDKFSLPVVNGVAYISLRLLLSVNCYMVTTGRC